LPDRPRLAVVNLDKVLERSERWADFQEELQRSQDKTRRTLEKYEREIRVLRSEYDNLPPGTDLAAETRGKIETSMREYRDAQTQLETEMRRQRMQALSEVFNQVNEIIRQYAQANNIDLVLKKQDLTVSATQPVELGVIVATADVLFARDTFDITDDIVRDLNARYPKEIKEK
jgi:Skp family chaperone for outer membrane proteins